MTDIDITADLTDGRDGALADNLPYNGQDGSPMQTPAGTQPVHGDAKPANQQVVENKPEPTLRDQLSSAFKGTDDKPAAQQEGQTVQQAAEPVVAAPALTKDAEGKYRNTDGTFASTDQIAAFEAASAAPQNTEQQVQSPLLSSMTPVEQEQFKSLPAETRQLVERTMEDLNTRAARYGEYDQIEQHILGPRREAFMREGTNPVVALNQLFALSDFAGRDPSNFVLWFSGQHNLDLDAMLDARDAANANVDPTVRQLQGQVEQLTGLVQQNQQREVQSVQQANLQAVEQFAIEKDSSGALKRPYLNDVMDSWATQISAIRMANPSMPNTEILDRAYQAACWSDPAVRTKMQQVTDNPQKRTDDAARVAAAKQAGSSVTGGPLGDQSTVPNNSNLTLRQELESQFRAASV